MLDDAYRVMFRHFGTFFLVPAVVVVPLHLLYSFFYRRVISLAELHPAIEELPARGVRGVASADIATARGVFWVILAVEILLLPVFATVTERAIGSEGSGETAGILTHWRRPLLNFPGLPPLPLLAATLAIAVTVGLLATWAVAPLAGVVPSHLAWAVAGLGTAAAHCGAAPFVLVPWAAAKGNTPSEPNL